MPYTDELKEEKLLLDAADDPEKLAQLRRSREPKSARREEAKPTKRQKRQRQLNKKNENAYKKYAFFFCGNMEVCGNH